jgi:hypothetical protein
MDDAIALHPVFGVFGSSESRKTRYGALRAELRATFEKYLE